ncbi:vacuolar amino acid transporter 3 [Acrodontium crateriforme]|uniref:Vacuolar amino acid transporter 3 n=1 Tax=Acrodontium crateriforme TaxID=150365 RepID=A0AAQ3M2V0_9PEZI|nr:vacuolar amino acid transporter 3 [Acrodontium crateriforme]
MADTPNSEQSRREAAIVDRHLPEGYSASIDTYNTFNDTEQSSQSGGEPVEESSLALQGGDMHRDIFKIKARANIPRRANTFSGKLRPDIVDPDEVSISEHTGPGGFRRQHVLQRGIQRRLSSVATPATRNFVSFLELYGSFAGEDLADTDDEEAVETGDEEEGPDDTPPGETRPLLARRRTTRRNQRQGDASTMRTFFTLLKAFVGTGIMFLPKAFRNGGILFSSIALVAVSLVTSLCFHLLLQCRKNCGGGGYGELGAAIFGPRFRKTILASITLSQLGFVCAGVIFTAENLLSFANAIAVSTGGDQPFGTTSLIAIQFVVLIPLALIRNISKLGPTALLADVFIMIGVTYIWWYDISSLATHGMAPSVQLFNPSAFTLTVGSAIFTFEGIGLILPIQSSMAKPEHFSKLLYLVMFIITIIFTSVGALCYATFGDETKIQIISNFPQDSKLVNAVQFLYSLAVLAGEPVQLFPAVRILETSIFGELATGKKSAAIKWKKNALRSATMTLCLIIAILGASDLDKFVALIGSFACVPLVYIYPPLLHYRAVAQTKVEKAIDIAVMVVGVIAMVYTTAVTLSQWAST